MVAIRRARQTFEPTDSVKEAIAFVLTRLDSLEPRPEWSWDDVGKVEWSDGYIDSPGCERIAFRSFRFIGDPRKYTYDWTLGMLELRLIDGRWQAYRFIWIDDSGLHSHEFETQTAAASEPPE
jgi:hypothetical protein